MFIRFLQGTCPLSKPTLVVLFLYVSVCLSAQSKPVTRVSASHTDFLQKLQPFFERNDGQLNPKILFFARGTFGSIWLERDRLVVQASTGSGSRASLNSASQAALHFVGAAGAKVEGTDRLPGITNYFLEPDRTKWITRVPQFASVTYRQIYPGIDLVFYFKDSHLEYDFVVSPGADPGAIRMRVEGAKSLLTQSGEIAISADGVELVRSRNPDAYQMHDRDRIIPVHYVLQGREIRFRVGRYDRRQSLVIDPALTWATFLAANCLPDPLNPCSNDGSVVDVAADSTGVYITGFTDVTSFPSVAGQPPVPAGPVQGYAVKLDPTGSKILYMTFIAHTFPFALAIDSAGEAFVAGKAQPGFPTTPGAFNSTDPACGTICNFPFAAKLSSDGSTLMYSTLLMAGDSSTTDDTIGIVRVAVDSKGELSLLGFVETSFLPALPLRFPTTVGSFQTNRLNRDGDYAVMKFSADGSALVYSSYLHPNTSGEQYAFNDMAVDASGAAYVTGFAGPSFPTTTGAYQTTQTAPTAVLSKLSPDGSLLDYSTFLGDHLFGSAVAVDGQGQAVIAGVGSSPPPTTPGSICVAGPGDSKNQGFIASFNAAGSALNYSTSLCTSNPAITAEDGVAVDSAGNAYVRGEYSTNGTPVAVPLFPLLDPIQSYNYQGPAARTLVKLDPGGKLLWGTFLGSSANTNASTIIDKGGRALGEGMAFDGTAIYVLGTDEFAPATPGSLQPGGLCCNGPSFLAKIANSLGAAVPVLTPQAFVFNKAQLVGTSSAPIDGLLGNFGDADMGQPSISISTGDFSETDNCTSGIKAAQKCDLHIVFTPTAVGTRTANLTVKINGFPDQIVPLIGQGAVPTLTLSTTSVTFGPQPVGTTSARQTVNVSNSGAGDLNISSLQITGDFAQTNTCGGSLTIGTSCTISITSTPTVAGKRTGTVTITDNAADSPQHIALTGFGGQSAGVSLSPQQLTFVGQMVGNSSAAQPVTIFNIGNLPLNIANISAGGDFTQTNNCTSPVNPSGNCVAQVTFSPTGVGRRNGTLTITSNSFTSPDSVLLSGTGIDFSFAVASSSSSTATVTAGQTAGYTLTATPMGAGGTLNFVCQGAPTNSSCTVSPASLTLNSSAQNVTVTVSTTANATTGVGTLDLRGKIGPLLAAVPGVLGILLLIFAVGQRRLRWTLATLAIFLFCAGCGGGGSGGGGGGGNGTPKGTFTIVVTATPGAVGAASHSTNLTLNVQ